MDRSWVNFFIFNTSSSWKLACWSYEPANRCSMMNQRWTISSKYVRVKNDNLLSAFTVSISIHSKHLNGFTKVETFSMSTQWKSSPTKPIPISSFRQNKSYRTWKKSSNSQKNWIKNGPNIKQPCYYIRSPTFSMKSPNKTSPINILTSITFGSPNKKN